MSRIKSDINYKLQALNCEPGLIGVCANAQESKLSKKSIHHPIH